MRSKPAPASTVAGSVRTAESARPSASAKARAAVRKNGTTLAESRDTARAPRTRRKFDEPADGFDPFATGSNVGDYLGRLDPSGEAPKPDTHVPLAEIRPFPGQPRRHFDPATIDDLAASIDREGLINPLTVRPAPEGGGYQLLAGERRYRAMVRLAAQSGATMMRVPVVVKAVSDLQARAITARENLDREDLSRYETALAYRHVAEVLREERGDDPGYEVLADYIGRALGVVHEYMTIAHRIDESTLTQAGFADAEGRPDYGRISRLTKSVLLKAAKATSDDTRLAMLAREADRITGPSTAARTAAQRSTSEVGTPQAIADRYYEEGGFRINLPGAFKKMLPQDAAKYLDAMLPALGCLADRAMSATPEKVFARPAGRGYVVYVPVVDGEQPDAVVQAAAKWLAAHAAAGRTL